MQHGWKFVGISLIGCSILQDTEASFLGEIRLGFPNSVAKEDGNPSSAPAKTLVLDQNIVAGNFAFSTVKPGILLF